MPDLAISGLTLATPGSGAVFPFSTPTDTRKADLDGIRAWLALVAPNVQTASYTLALPDAWREVHMDVATANSLTVPPDSSVAFPLHATVAFGQKGAGTTTLVPGSGVTIRSPYATLDLRARYSRGRIRKIGTDEWWLEGDFA